MRAYAETLVQALSEHAPEIDARLIELDPVSNRSSWRRRLHALTLPLSARRHRRLAPDCWHVLDGSRAHLASAFAGAPIAITAHDIIPWLQDRGRFPGVPRLSAPARWWWRGNADAMRRADMVVCDSRQTQQDLRAEFGVSSEQSSVVSLPVRPPMARRVAATAFAAREPGVVVHIGNAGFYKNRAGALRVFSRLGDEVGRTLLMLGPAPSMQLRAEAASLGLAGRVQWVVDPDDDAVAAVYRRASALVFPSLYEGFGWPVLEAMAFGLPVVCSNAASLPEIAGDAARLFAPGDEEGMALALRELLQSPEAWQRAADLCRVQAQRFDRKDFARSMLVAYRTAIARRSRIR
ncbi:glycosyltransferase family 4 protein [Arenimonas sp.]|uniref:glycosyltransferase family 4 protein n=1 Tax=Arenimonas sp. TaxID=1872635 RepID=UPI0039E4006E